MLLVCVGFFLRHWKLKVWGPGRGSFCLHVTLKVLVKLPSIPADCSVKGPHNGTLTDWSSTKVLTNLRRWQANQTQSVSCDRKWMQSAGLPWIDCCKNINVLLPKLGRSGLKKFWKDAEKPVECTERYYTEHNSKRVHGTHFLCRYLSLGVEPTKRYIHRWTCMFAY